MFPEPPPLPGEREPPPDQKTQVSHPGAQLSAEAAFLLTEDELRSLEQIAEERGMARGEVVREMVLSFLRYR